MRLTAAQAVDVALEHARGVVGVVDLVAIASHDSTISLRWANNTLTTNNFNWANSLTIVAYVHVPASQGEPAGVATATLSEVDHRYDIPFVRGLVDAAIAAANANEPARHPQNLPAELRYGNWDTEPVRTDVDVIGTITGPLGDVLRRGAAERRNHSGYAEHERSSTWVGSLSGIRLRDDDEDGRVEMTSRSSDGIRSAWEGKHTRSFTDVDITAMGAALERQLSWQNRRRDLPAGRYRTILPPGPVGDLLATFDMNLVGRSAIEGSGPFTRSGGTLLGERIAGRRSYDLYSDPAHPLAPQTPYVVDAYDSSVSSTFDTGQPVPRVDWVRDGVLTALCASRAVAAETGLPYVPNVGNLILDIDGAQGSIDDVIARTESGLLVNCLWYIRDLDDATMTVTGTTRDGVYEVRDGEVIGAVNNFRFNESPMQVLRRVVDAGTPVLCQTRENAETVSDYLMPSLVVDDFNMASVSEAL